MRWWLAALLLWPVAAQADPITAVAFLAPYIGGAAAAFLVSNAVYIFYAAVAAYGINRQNAAKRKARAAYNDSLRDRLQMADLEPDAARTSVLGRVRTVEGIRRRWSSGTNSEKLTLIISFAGHEIDAFEQFYWADIPLTLDGSGYVTTAPFGRTVKVSKSLGVTLNGSGGGAFALPTVPIGGSVWAVYGTGTGLDYTDVPLTVSVSGSTVTLSGGAAAASATIQWQTSEIRSALRIRTYLGTAAQNVGAALAAEYPGKISSTDKFAGIALAVVDLDYDPDIYPQGLQSITALLRGAKLYDPRLDSTVPGGSGSHRLATPSTWAWSQNPALQAYHYARLANGQAVPAAEIRTADVMAAASVCDVSTVFTLRKADGSTSTVTLPRHQGGIVIPTDADPKAMMDEIMEAMAGRNGWAGGTWRMRAGTMATPVFDLQASWIAQRLSADGSATGGAVVRISNGVPRDAKVNRVTGTCVDRDQRYQALPFPALQDAVLIAAEGSYPLEVEYQAVTHVAHAQHLASIAIRESQASLRMEAACNLSAYRCELFDVGTLELPRYGMSGKTVEVTGWRWSPAEGVTLNLAEITADIFVPVAELVGRDPAPDSDLPSPWDVEAIAIDGITSGTTPLTDGSILTRTRVEWAPAVSQAIRRGGSIEVQYTPGAEALPTGDWPSWVEQGDSTVAVIPGLLGRSYIFRARAVNSLRVRGPWSAQVAHVVASTRGVKTFRQTTAPAGGVSREGDIWYDTDDGNHPYVRTGGAWVSVRDASIAAALSTALAAQATADGKIDTFWQTTAPSGGVSAEGDLWFDTNDSYKQYRYTSGTWVIAADTRIGDAINDAADAQATADGKVTTFVQTSAPTATAVGDLWFDSDAEYRPYRWSGSAWVSVRDASIAAALAAANDAQATADGKIATFYQTTAPSGGVSSVGDLWFDTNDGYKQYRYSGSAWVIAADTRIGTAINDAADAQATADGKVVTFVQTSAPTAEGVGDLWLDSNDGNKLYRWSGSAWVALPVGTGGLAPGAATDVYVDTVSAVVITGQTGAPFGTTTTISSLSFSAPVTGDALILCSGNCTTATGAVGVAPDPIENMRTSMWVDTNGGGSTRLTDSSVYQQDASVGYSTTIRYPVHFIKRIAVTAGSSYVVTFRGQKLHTESTVTVNDLEMRAEIIKR